jgi:multidrug resistance protein, MATE family
MKLAAYFPYYKRNLHLALPVVISQIGQVSVSLVDTMMVGHVGTTELAAASFANSVFINGMVFGMGITFGLTPLIGKAYGKGNMPEALMWLKNGVLTHSISAVFLCLVMTLVYFFLPKMGQTPEVTALAGPYYLILCASYIPFMLFFTLKQFFEGLGNTRMAMKITIAANLLNILFNYLFIYGKFGFPEMGLNGAGIGTLISRIAMPLMFVYFIFRKPLLLNYFTEAHKLKIEREKIISLLRIGIPIAFQIIVEVIAFSVGAIMMGWHGKVPLAAHQVAIGLATFTYMISLGISQANTIRVSHQMGLHDYNGLKMAAFASTHLVLAFMSVMGIVFIVTRNFLPYLFTTDAEVITIAAGLLIIAAVFQVFDGLQVVMLSTLRGMADVKIPMIFAIVAYLFIGLPISYFFSFILNTGPVGIWYGYLAGLGIAGIMFYLRFQYNLKKQA